MSYTQDDYRRAEEVLERRRERANMETDLRRAKINEEIPELAGITQELAQVGLNISKVFIFSDNKQADMEKLKEQSLALQKKRAELLKQHGYNEDVLEVSYHCKACGDTGLINNRRCKCVNEILKDLQRERLSEIAPLEDSTFESFDVNYYPDTVGASGISPRQKAERIKESCRKYATSFTTASNNVMFMGGTGLGKTHLSLAIANAVINRGFSVIYGTAQNILSDLENEKFGRTDRLRYSEADVLGCDLLIIDDLGTEFKNSYTVACLYNIINTRISSRRPTVISTNYTWSELEEQYDQRITSRITGIYSQLVLEGNDIRYIKK